MKYVEGLFDLLTMGSRGIMTINSHNLASNRYIYIVLTLLLFFAIIVAAILSVFWLVLVLLGMVVITVTRFLKRLSTSTKLGFFSRHLFPDDLYNLEQHLLK